MGMKQTFRLASMGLALFFFSLSALAQNPYGEVTFVEVHPGMADTYLNAMKGIKKINNGLKANKTINSWQLYRRVFPSGSAMGFNYATFQVFPSGKEMQARKDWGPWDAPVKDLSAKEVISTFTNTSTVRTVLARDLYTFKMGVGGAANGSRPGDYVSVSRVKVTAANMEAYEKMLETAKPAIEEAIKSGKIKSWNVWKRTFATNVDGASDYTIGFSFATLDEALSWASGKTDPSAEYKKVYPKEDYNVFRSKLASLREMVSQELWELVDVTD
jgi:hypothetical protein